MEWITYIQGPMIGLIGWAATAALTLGARKLNATEQHSMIVFAWMLWMIPALGTLVYHGLLDINAAALYCGGTTILMAILVSIATIRWRTKP
jgi:uncharacterized membrane protein